MKQCLLYLLILIFSVPAFAGGDAIGSDMQQSHLQTDTADTQQGVSSHCHHSSAMTEKVTVDPANHNCCDQNGTGTMQSHTDCENNCGECSHSCSGFCLALLPSSHKTVAAQSQLHTNATTRLPAAPYQNPLIPPII